MNEQSDQLLGELHGKMDLVIRGMTEDREDRRKFREEMRDENKITRDQVKALEQKIAPVVFHHQIIVRGSRWLVVSVGGILGAVKAWIFLKDHIAPK